MMSDGHLGKCKTCAKRDMRVDRLTKPRVREYDRQRAKLPHRVALNARVSKAWALRHHDRRLAQGRAQVALKAGVIRRPLACEACGLPKRLEKHHPDYSQPLIVQWLCKPCHAVADKQRRERESRVPF